MSSVPELALTSEIVTYYGVIIENINESGSEGVDDLIFAMKIIGCLTSERQG